MRRMYFMDICRSHILYNEEKYTISNQRGVFFSLYRLQNQEHYIQNFQNYRGMFLFIKFKYSMLRHDLEPWQLGKTKIEHKTHRHRKEGGTTRMDLHWIWTLKKNSLTKFVSIGRSSKAHKNQKQGSLSSTVTSPRSLAESLLRGTTWSRCRHISAENFCVLLLDRHAK